MATRKAAPKTIRNTAAKAGAKANVRAPRKAPGKSGAKTRPRADGGGPKNAGGDVNIRVRMYRIGFGDFFLLTVPGKDGPAHILIDCGVHAAPVKGAMDACVQDMKKVTGNRLALVILTHFHADHMSGFASNFDDFANFDHVGAVWITNRLDPDNQEASKFMAQITAVALQLQLQLRLAARTDVDAIQAAHMVENALGASGEDGGGGSNAKALGLLQSGFKSKPPVFYYQGGDTPTLPAELEGMITAEILGPSPKDSGGEFAASDNKKEQYLAAVGEDGLPDSKHVQPFDKKMWPGRAADYPAETFDEFDSGITSSTRKRKDDGAARLEGRLADMQPDVLAAVADKLDGTLNNQSLVILFTCQKKKLLFVGDAQWGNWAYWLYGKGVTGADPGISSRAQGILSSIDFYKVGHHGSTNATPIPAVGAINEHCASMCSTAMHAYGNLEKGTEVPRTVLLDSLEKRTGKRLVRSDWVAAAGTDPDPEADAPSKLPDGFTTSGELYIDYNL